MQLGQRLRLLRKQRNLSLGDLEKRIGLMRTYLSRVERGRTIPTLETLERLASGLDVPLYKFFCNGTQPNASTPRFARDPVWGNAPREARELQRLWRLLQRTDEFDRELLLSTAERMARLS